MGRLMLEFNVHGIDNIVLDSGGGGGGLVELLKQSLPGLEALERVARPRPELPEPTLERVSRQRLERQATTTR